MKTVRNLFSLFLLSLLLVLGMSAAAHADELPGIPYLDSEGNTQICTNYTLVTSEGPTRWHAGWYVVKGSASIWELHIGAGDVHLILCDGASLDLRNGILSESPSYGDTCFYVYGQSTGKDMGKMTVNKQSAYAVNVTSGIIINGGNIIIQKGWCANYGFSSDNITINGGNVDIYTGRHAIEGDNVTINGGTVLAHGDTVGINASGNLTFNGGSVTVISSGDYDSVGAFRDYTKIPGIAIRCNGKLTLNNGMHFWIGKDPLNRQPADSPGSELNVYVAAKVPVTYKDPEGVEHTTEDCTLVEGTTERWENGNYVVWKNTQISKLIEVRGDVNLILREGATLDAFGGIELDDGASLTIDGTGMLNAYDDGIDCYWHWRKTSLTVKGGSIESRGHDTGIRCGSLTVTNGRVTAIGRDDHGIDCESFTCSDGNVMAIGGYGSGIHCESFILNGGTLIAESREDENLHGISSESYSIAPGVTVWANNSGSPRYKGNIIKDFARDHDQRYVYASNVDAVITGADLVLDGTLKLRFYVFLSEGFSDESAAMDMTVHGRTITQKLSEAERIDGKYAFTCPVYSIEMAEPVRAVFRCSGGKVEKSVSVKEYLDTVMNILDRTPPITMNLSAEDAAKLRNMITAARNYGHYMQTYLADVHGFTVGEDKDYRAIPAGSEITPLTALPEYKRSWGPKRFDSSVLASIQYYDDFKESTTLNIDLKLKTRVSSLSATVDGKDWSAQSVGDNTWRISIPDIAANNLGKAFHVELTVNGSVVYDAYLSALSYVSAVLDAHRDNENEAKALTAFYQYYQAAKAFE